ncbi:uncharacterized protein LOC119663568 [Teleopsis dalmanni]|uniref:uncharacterized protein LOC119663568 n=1 Tax=Teleopsis dalmanni TaxID=139649 RepID=UPI0018CD05B8|nr:uncharacterized protein LOC119663568 [Teleopsis dalmanni]
MRPQLLVEPPFKKGFGCGHLWVEHQQLQKSARRKKGHEELDFKRKSNALSIKLNKNEHHRGVTGEPAPRERSIGYLVQDLRHKRTGHSAYPGAMDSRWAYKRPSTSIKFHPEGLGVAHF